MCTARTSDLEKQMLCKRTSKENDDVLIEIHSGGSTYNIRNDSTISKGPTGTMYQSYRSVMEQNIESDLDG